MGIPSRLGLTCLPAVAALFLIEAGPAALGQNGAAPVTSAAVDVASMDAPAREAFLARAKIVSVKSPPKGTTNTKRVTLSDGTLTHDASVQTIDDAKAVLAIETQTQSSV